MPLDDDTDTADATRRALFELIGALRNALRPSGLALTPALVSALQEAQAVLRETPLGLPVMDRS